MTSDTVERFGKDNIDTVRESGYAAEKIVEGNIDALTNSRNTSISALRELSEAYQELTVKNGKHLTAAIQALSAAKSPTEFIGLQQQLVKDGIQAAVNDSQHIARLTAAVFATAFEPVKKQ